MRGVGTGSHKGSTVVLFPAIAGLVLRLSAKLGVTAPLGVGSAMADQSSNADTYAGGSFTLVTDGGMPAIELNGSTDALFGGLTLATLLPSMDRFVAIAVWSNTSTVAPAAANSGYAEPALLAEASAGFYPLFGDNTNMGGGKGGPDVDQRIANPGGYVYHQVALTTAAGGTLTAQVGTAGTPATPLTGVGGIGGAGTQVLRLGQNYNGSKHAKGRFRELILASAMTAPELAAYRAFVKYEFGSGL